MKIVVTDYIENNLDWEKEQFQKLGIEFFAYQLKCSSKDELIKKIIDADIIIVNMVTMGRDVLKKLKKCKLIIRHGVGYDNIDIKAAKEFKIIVSHIPDYCTDEVAEQTVMLFLNIYRKFTQQSKSINSSFGKSEWDFSSLSAIKRLSGKTAGLIGCGRIGQKVLKILQGFNVKVLVNDPIINERKLYELGVCNSTIEEVLTQSDMISIHCTLNSNTYHLIGEKELRMMKSEAVLVNTARAGIIDTYALAKACKERWIAGACIDVYDIEPPPHNFPLRDLENVILTPHLSWYSKEAEWDIRRKIVEDVHRFINGELPRYPLSSD